jgi:hypothetical protein
MKRCLLHIGAPKTGFTALQKFLAANYLRLRGLGLHYPEASLRGFGHHDIAFLVAGGYPDWATAQDRPLEEMVRDLAAEIAGSEAAALSSENFYLQPNPPGVARLLEQAGIGTQQVQVVVYLRRQDEAHLSWYNQAVKAQGYSGTIAESIAATDALWDYSKQLARWAAVFGTQNILVRIYQPPQSSCGDIRRDFLRVAGLAETGFDFPAEAVNSRINAEILEFQRVVNRLPLTPQQKRGAHRELIALTAATEGTEVFDDPPLLGTEERFAILARYAEGNTAVARTYLSRAHLFDDAMPQGLPRRAERARLDTEKLVYILGWLMARRPNT